MTFFRKYWPLTIVSIVLAAAPVLIFTQTTTSELIDELGAAKKFVAENKEIFPGRQADDTLTELNNTLKGLYEALGFEDGLRFSGTDDELESRLEKLRSLYDKNDRQRIPLKQRSDLTVKESITLERLHERLSHLEGEIKGLTEKRSLNSVSTPAKKEEAIAEILESNKYKGRQFSLSELRKKADRVLEVVEKMKYDVEAIQRRLFALEPPSETTFEQWRQKNLPSSSKRRKGFVLIPSRKDKVSIPQLQLYAPDYNPDLLPFERLPAPPSESPRLFRPAPEAAEAPPKLLPFPSGNSAPCVRSAGGLTRGIIGIFRGILLCGVQIGFDLFVRTGAAPEKEKYRRLYTDCVQSAVQRTPADQLAVRMSDIDKYCHRAARQGVQRMLLDAPAVSSLGMSVIEDRQTALRKEARAQGIMAFVKGEITRTFDDQEAANLKAPLLEILKDPDYTSDIKTEAARLLTIITDRQEVLEDFAGDIKNQQSSPDGVSSARQDGSPGERNPSHENFFSP